MDVEHAVQAPAVAMPLPVEDIAERVAASPWAERWRRMADEVSMSRAVGGLALGIYIGMTEYPADSWAVPAAAAAGAGSDWLDGWLARRATARDGQRSKLGAWLDQLTDKVFVGALVGGVAVGAFASGRQEFGATIAVFGGIIAARDMYVTRLRNRAENSGAEVNTAAQWHGKAKTATQFAALMALVSPAMESRPAGWAAAGLLGVSAAMAIWSAWRYKGSFDQAMVGTES